MHWVIVKIGLDYMPPLTYAALRLVTGLATVVALLGILLFFVVLHIARAVGWMHGRIAEGLLVRL